MLFDLRQPVYAIYIDDVHKAVKKLGDGWRVAHGVTPTFATHSSGLRAMKGEWVVVSPTIIILADSEFKAMFTPNGEDHA